MLLINIVDEDRTKVSGVTEEASCGLSDGSSSMDATMDHRAARTFGWDDF
jgi:hypothetical protein